MCTYVCVFCLCVLLFTLRCVSLRFIRFPYSRFTSIDPDSLMSFIADRRQAMVPYGRTLGSHRRAVIGRSTLVDLDRDWRSRSRQTVATPGGLSSVASLWHIRDFLDSYCSSNIRDAACHRDLEDTARSHLK